MLTKKKQRHYLADKEQQWLQQLEAFSDSHDEEALHRLRVEVKKIGALVKLTTAQSGKRAAGHFRKLKEMFREAGMIRDAGSQARWLEQRQLLTPEEREQRAASVRTAGETFAMHIGEYRRKGRKASDRLLADVHSIHARQVRRWFAQEILDVGILLSKKGAEIHDARKKLKTILYVHKLLPAPIRQQILLNIGYLDRLQDAIGQWHDAVVVHSQEAGGSPATETAIKQEIQDKEQTVIDLSNAFAVEIHRV